MISQPIRGFAAQTLGGGEGMTGLRHVAIHYTADPSKTPAWVAREKSKMAAEGKGTRDWDREMELREDVYEGQPVFEMYEDLRHAPLKFAKEIPVLDDSVLIGGWDCGQTLQPAFALIQVTQAPYQVHAMLEVYSEGGESMEDFAPRVFTALARWHPGRWDDVRHYGDGTVVNRSGSDGRSAQAVAKKHGFHIKAQPNAWQRRWSAVTWLLNRQLDERTPGFMICREKCPVLHAGFQGAYRLEERKDRDGNVRDLLEPLKNRFSHVQDALQYGALEARRMIEGGGARLQGAD